MTASASAHHVMGGKTPATFVEGLLSGLGHPGHRTGSPRLPAGDRRGRRRRRAQSRAAGAVRRCLGDRRHAARERRQSSRCRDPGRDLGAACRFPDRARTRPPGFAVGGAFRHRRALPRLCVRRIHLRGGEVSRCTRICWASSSCRARSPSATALFVRRKGGGVSALAPRLAGAVIIGVGLATLIAQLIPGA